MNDQHPTRANGVRRCLVRSITTPEELLDALDQLAVRHYVTRSEVFTAAALRLLACDGVETKRLMECARRLRRGEALGDVRAEVAA